MGIGVRGLLISLEGNGKYEAYLQWKATIFQTKPASCNADRVGYNAALKCDLP